MRFARIRPWLYLAIPLLIVAGVGIRVVLKAVRQTVVLNIANATDRPVDDVRIAYGGNELRLDRLEPRQQVSRQVRPVSSADFSLHFVDADGKPRSDGFGAKYDQEYVLTTSDNQPIDVEIGKDSTGQLYLKVHRAWMLGDSALSGTIK